MTKANKIISAFTIFALISILVLYCCPLKYVQVWQHPGAYYSVLHMMEIEYYWILYTSVILNLVTIIFSIIILIIKFKKIGNKLNWIIYSYYFLIALCIIFTILTFIFAFVYSTNYPRTI